MTEGVEWAVHCCTVLAFVGPGETLPSARLAEFHEVPPAYLAKHLQALTAAGVTASVPGSRGGYRLGRRAEDITLLDIVLAVDGDDPAFRCTEVRQRGPAAGGSGSPAYRRPCGIARAMWQAEDAWRESLRSTTVADLCAEILRTVPSDDLARGAEWVQQVQVRRRSRR